jgi:hypothetical protein
MLFVLPLIFAFALWFLPMHWQIIFMVINLFAPDWVPVLDEAIQLLGILKRAGLAHGIWEARETIGTVVSVGLKLGAGVAVLSLLWFGFHMIFG